MDGGWKVPCKITYHSDGLSNALTYLAGNTFVVHFMGLEKNALRQSTCKKADTTSLMKRIDGGTQHESIQWNH